MPYRRKHVKSKVHRIMPRRSIFRRLWFWITILLLIIISAIAYFALFYSGFQLENVAIFGNANVKTQDLQTIVFEYATTGLINFWNIKITSRSVFLINEEKISNDILKRFIIIGQAKVNKILPQTIILDIAERETLGVFCSNTEQCFLIDGNGITFAKINPELLDANYPIVRQSIENNQIFTGEEVVAQNIISAISKIQKSLKDNFQIDLKEALITSPVRLNITTNENWQIYFDLSSGSDIGSQLTKLGLLLNGGISADDRKNLRYIDLRPKDRAIICDNKTCGG